MRTITRSRDFNTVVVTNNVLTQILRSRLKNCSKEDFDKALIAMKECPQVKNQFNKKAKEEDAQLEFPNKHLEMIYKIQMWESDGSTLSDDVLQDTMQQNREMDSHFSVYQHMFEFNSDKITFVQDKRILDELAKAAIWCSEILTSLSAYISCIPVWLIPFMLKGYPQKNLLDECVPGIFIFDMIHLFPMLFPFCETHDFCAGLCLTYSIPSAVNIKHVYKFVGGLLSLVDGLEARSMSLIFTHMKQLYPAVARMKFKKFIQDADFLLTIDICQRYHLRHDKIEAFTRGTLNISDGATAAEPSKLASLKTDDPWEDNLLLDQNEFIVKLAQELFCLHGAKEMPQTRLVAQINESYQDLCQQGIPALDIHFILEESKLFEYSNDNLIVRYLK